MIPDASNSNGNDGLPAYTNRSLNIDQYYLNKIGLSRDGTQLKIGDFEMYGVPVALSLDTGRILLVLSPKEQHLFKDYIGSPVRLFLRTRARRDERADLKIILLNAKLESLENLAQNENLCLVNLRYIHSPNEYREKISSYFFDSDYYREKYNQCLDKPEDRIPYGRLIPESLNRQVHVRFPDGGKRTGALQSILPCEVEVYLEAKEGELNTGEATAAEFFFPGFNAFVKATVKSFRPSAEVSGFGFAVLTLAFHPAITELLLPVMTGAK